MTRRRQKSKDDDTAWVAGVGRAVAGFLEKHAKNLSFSEERLCALFEVGCFLTVVADYEQKGFKSEAHNLQLGTEFRFSTRNVSMAVGPQLPRNREHELRLGLAPFAVWQTDATVA